MAGDESRVVSAYIDVKARKAFANEEMRRLGHEAGREFEKGYQAEVDKSLASGKAKRAAQGKQVGADIGDPAGKEAGARTSAGITDSLARSRGRRRKDGEDLGAVLGAAAGARAGRSTTDGLSAKLKASYGSFSKDGARLGDVLGAAMGDHAAGLTRKAIRRELDAEAKIRARETAIELRAAAASLRAREKAAAAGARLAAQEARAQAAAIRTAEREAAKAAREAERAQVARVARLAKISSRVGSVNRGGVLGALGIGGVASSLSGLGGLLAGTVGAVAQLSGALALLPAVGVAAGVGLAAVKIGVHDVGNALSDSGDPKKYAEDLKKLSPAARSFTKAVVALKPELKALRNEVQEGLFKGLDKQVTALGDRYIPILSKGLTGTSKAFNAAGQDVGEFLDKAQTGKQVSGIFADISKAAGKLAYAVKPAVASLLDVADVGTGFLPRFADKITDLTKRFRGFVGQAKRSGELKDFIQGGIDGFKQLGKIVGNTGRILGGIFGAGGGAKNGALAALAGILGGIADQIARPEFQKGLGNFFASIKSAGASVGDALPKVADALVALEPAISKLVAGSGTALASILTTVSNAAISLAPAITKLASGFQALAPHAGAIVVGLTAFKGAVAGLGLIKFATELIAVRKAFVAGEIAVKEMTVAQYALNIALDANPIGLVVVGLAALAAGLIYAYKHSETFRNAVNGAFKAVAGTVLGVVSKIIGAMGSLFGVLGHLPGKAGSTFRSAANAARTAKGSVDRLRDSLNGIKSKTVTIHVNTTRAIYGTKGGHYEGSTFVPNMTGGLVDPRGFSRRAVGGLIDPRLGAPRQDNVPLLVSGGEFVMNAYATAARGVLPLLRYINAAGKLPQKLAGGGQVVGRASMGLGDLTSAQPARIARIEAARAPAAASNPGPGRWHPDDLAVIVQGFAAAMRGQKIVLDTGAIAGGVFNAGGRF